MLNNLKLKIKRFGILNKNKKLCEHFGLIGTILKMNESDVFERAEFECSGFGNEICLGGNVNLNGSHIYIYGSNNKITIKENCYLSDSTLWIEGDNNEKFIGKRCYINVNTNLTCTEGCKLIIGDNCLFSTDIYPGGRRASDIQ